MHAGLSIAPTSGEDLQERPGIGQLRVAIVDAETGFTRVLGRRVEAAGWRLQAAGGMPAVDELREMRLHALIVDLVLAGDDAWRVLGTFRDACPSLALIVCTGPSTVAQRVRGLRQGADDWVTKPCHPEELMARVEAVVRRRAEAPVARADDQVLRCGELEIMPPLYQAFIGGRGAGLTRKEFEVLTLLARADGRVLERDEIYDRVWGYRMAHGDRSVDVFVRKIRQKLQAVSPGWRYVHTHFGVGYRFAAEPVDEDALARPAKPVLPPADA